jgi:hypothetical protein
MTVALSRYVHILHAPVWYNCYTRDTLCTCTYSWFEGALVGGLEFGKVYMGKKLELDRGINFGG